MESAGNLVKNLVRDFHTKLAGMYPEQEIRQFTYILFEHYMGWSRTRVHLHPEAEIPSASMNLFDRALDDLVTGKPIQYITGNTLFNDSLLMVGPGVLIPRPETEQLCDLVRKDFAGFNGSGFSILDIGTGSGCIAIDLKKRFPSAEVTAVDHSPEALEIAKANAVSNSCKINFNRVDILNHESWIKPGKFNLVVSNPPYVLEQERRSMHRNVTDFEPGMALFVPDSDPLLFYRAIAAFASGHAAIPARLYVEINERYGSQVCELFLNSGYKEATVVQDFHGKDRFVRAVGFQ